MYADSHHPFAGEWMPYKGLAIAVVLCVSPIRVVAQQPDEAGVHLLAQAKAIDYFRKSLEIHQVNSGGQEQAFTLARMAEAYNRKGDFQEAAHMAAQALSLSENRRTPGSRLAGPPRSGESISGAARNRAVREGARAINCHH
jgi:hypothetical protein